MGDSSASKRFRSFVILTLLGIFAAFLLGITSCSSGSEPETWRYSQFLQAVEQSQVETVIINPSRTQAIVETQDGERVLVNLPNDPDLVSILERNRVEIVVLPPTSNVGFDRVVPLLLLVGLLMSLFTGFLFWAWALVDCATKESSEDNTKIVWILVILLANWVGALIYIFVRKPERLRESRK